MTNILKKLADSQVELTVSLDRDDLQGYLDEVEKKLANDLRLEGFRTGHVPRELVRKHFGLEKIRQLALELAVQSSLGDALKKESLEVISQADFKIKENSPSRLVFRVVLTVFPEVKLGQYRGLNVKRNSVQVDDSEIARVLNDLKKTRTVTGGTGYPNEVLAPGQTKPDDTLAQSLGHFKSLVELEASIREGLTMEKENKERERVRLAILNQVAANSEFELPKLLVEERLDALVSEFDHGLHQKGMELGLYLAKIKKTQDDLKNDWRAKAQVQVRLNLVARAIARRENIGVTEVEVDQEFALLAEHYTRGGMIENLQAVDPTDLKARIREAILREKTFEFLEKNNVVA